MLMCSRTLQRGEKGTKGLRGMDTEAQRDPKRMFLSAVDAVVLLVVYLLAMVFGLIVVIRALLIQEPSSPAANLAVFYCASMSLVGTSVFYVRKLYKALINDTYSFGVEEAGAQFGGVSLRRLGTISYFVFRPLFGVAFSVVVYSLWRLSLSASGIAQAKLTEGFLFTTISLGFLSGFLAGRLLNMLEGYGTRRLSGLMGAEHD